MKTLNKFVSFVLAVVFLAASFTVDFSVFAADTVVREKVFIDFNDQQLYADFVSQDTEVVFSDKDSVSDGYYLEIHNCDMSWDDLKAESHNVSVEFKFRCTPEFVGRLDVGIDTLENSEDNIILFSITHQDDVLSLIDSSGKLVQTFSYNTTYNLKAEITRGSELYNIYIDNTKIDSESSFPYKIYSVDGVNFKMNKSGDNSFIAVDDLKIYEEGKSYPQKYSAQEIGKVDEPDVESVEKDGISLYINSTEIHFSDDLFVENNTVYVPSERLFESVGMDYSEDDNSIKVLNDNLNLVFSVDSNIITVNGKNIVLNNSVCRKNSVVYVPLNLLNESLNADIWWEDSSDLVVITTGKAKSDNILKSINGKLFMNGKPYYEISFLYEDLLRNIWKAYKINSRFYANSPEYNEAEAILKEMSELGFNSLRTYFWDDNAIDVLQSESEKNMYFTSIDIMFDLCDKYNIRVVPCLGLNSKMYLNSVFVEGYGWVVSDETVVDLVSSPESVSRKKMINFLHEFVNKYSDRETVLMWELCDAANVVADCGSTNGTVSYSLLQLSEFYKNCSNAIREIDKKHLITGGDGLLRTSQWHLFVATMQGENEDWTFDTATERIYALSLLNESFDVISVHGFNVGINTNAESFYSDENGLKVQLSFSHLLNEASVFNKPLLNGATNGEIRHISADGTESLVIDGQIRYLESLIESGVQLSYWQLDNGEKLNMDFFSRNSLAKAVADANTLLKQRYIINNAAVDNTNKAWSDVSVEVFDPEKIDPGTSGGIATDFFYGIGKVTISVVVTLFLICFVMYFMKKNNISKKRSKR